ncbi:MAG: sodium/solute symporter [Candidatus Omnitrophica bacterium]|nr:sodium/solute symporter [Candidatus Omnitrophota bacterium]
MKSDFGFLYGLAFALFGMFAQGAEPAPTAHDWSQLPPLPPAPGQTVQCGLAGPFVGVHHDALIVAGGANFPKGAPWEKLPDGSAPPKVWWNDVYAFQKQADGSCRWQARADFTLPRPLAYGASVSTPDGIVCIGGNDAGRCYSDVFLLKWLPDEGRIETERLPSLPRPLSFMAAAKVTEIIYVAGGQEKMKNSRASTNFWALDWTKRHFPEQFAWRELPPWPGPGRVEPIAVAQSNGSEDCFYLISGRYETPGAESVPLADAYCFEPSHRAWKRLKDLPATGPGEQDGRSVMAGTGIGFGSSRIVVFGGADGPLSLRLERLANRVSQLRKEAESVEQPSRKAELAAQADAVELELSNTFKSHPGFSRDIVVYSTKTGDWEVQPGALPFASPVDTLAVPWGNSIVIPTGEIRPGVRSLQVWKAVSPGPVSSENTAPIQQAVSPQLRDRAVGILRGVMSCESLDARLRAAEMLVSLDYPQQVREMLLVELSREENDRRSRIEIESILALATRNQSERREWINRIRDTFLHSRGIEQGLAAQALGRLRYQISDEPAERTAFYQAADSSDAELALGARRVLAGSGLADDRWFIDSMLASRDVQVRAQCARALQSLPSLSQKAWQSLTGAVASEPIDSEARIYLISAAFVHVPNDRVTEPFQTELIRYAGNGNSDQRAQACRALAVRGGMAQLPLLASLLDNPEPGVRAAAAWAILRIDRRGAHSMSMLDWLVIAVYGMFMLGVGWYYSRRTTTADDYLLGGRNMRSWTVGLSLFATLLSTLSYVAYPGEIAKYGPMILAGFLSYPVVYLVVGWLLIPFIMKLRVTSAYEILETRLGLSVRLLGSFFFLSLRLLWMATIIYVTASTVMVPVLGLNPEWGPWIAVGFGLTTIVYATMGGLRAVVITDVIQTFILFLGATVALALIIGNYGGSAEWIPRTWLAHWEPPKLWFDPHVRVTLAGALLLNFLWYVCTAGSDQIAIQRYLATRDVKAARRAMGTSLAADFSVTVLLSALGLALFAFFSAHPYLMADGQSVMANADNLFPRFIAIGLPVGLSGLVVAGVLAAAMSSLASGINASCSVVTVDLINRFRGGNSTERESVRRAKATSVAVGIAVLLLSLLAGYVKGNVLELMNKMVNLFVAPLFFLFFMAMFVPWATALGTFLGAIAGVAVAVAIAYFEVLGLKFVWIMPCSLATGMLVGMTASLLPTHWRRREKGLGT